MYTSHRVPYRMIQCKVGILTMFVAIKTTALITLPVLVIIKGKSRPVTVTIDGFQ